MTRGSVTESWVVAITQERAVIGTLRQPRIYQMANGDELTVLWSGEDREFRLCEFTDTRNFHSEMAVQRRWSRAGGAA